MGREHDDAWDAAWKAVRYRRAEVGTARDLFDAGVAAEARRSEILRIERDQARAQREHLLKVLTGIHALLPPDPVDVDGTRFVYQDPDANQTLRLLKRRIVEIEEQCKSEALAQKTGSVNNRG